MAHRKGRKDRKAEIENAVQQRSTNTIILCKPYYLILFTITN
jgi:hypothetical protein